MKICIFPGTFNPIHKAHINAASFVVQNLGFDKIIFIPAYKPPHKNYDIEMPNHRYNMVKLAVSDNPNFEVSDIEYRREGISYTYLTILELYKIHKVDGKISMIIGTDAFRQIESWYKTQDLKSAVDFIVFKREYGDNINLDYYKGMGYNFTIAGMDFFDISSTQLRDMISKGLDISNFVTADVERYIKDNGLYGYKKQA